MTIEELRKQVIQCRTLKEMRTVWEMLSGAGETMYTNTFHYPKAENFEYWAGRWMSSINKPTVSYQNFMTEFGTPAFDRDWLRKQVIGGFNSLDEMKEAWELLRSVGENMIYGQFFL